jgi:RHS repeat-associated protein
MIKVMAGDKLDILGKSYHTNTTAVTNANSTALNITTLLANLFASPSSTLGSKGITAADFTAVNNGLIPSTFFTEANNEPTTTLPKAYINYIFFDEQFKYAGGYASRVGASGTVKDHWNADFNLQNIVAPKNGFIFVYVSNESNMNVFFDNLQVVHKPGPILEETHYYPFGLTMSGISSKASNLTQNRFKYNAASKEEKEEFLDGTGLEMYDFNARTYDAQIGRFMQMDPLVDIAEEYSPYNYAINNPVSFNDPSGLKEGIGGKGFTPEDKAMYNEVVVYPTSYRKKIHNYYNSLNVNDWELIAYRMRKKGMNDEAITNHFDNLGDAAKGQLQRGMFRDAFNTSRIASTRAGDKVFLNVMCTLIPVGRLVKWGGTGIKFLANASNKPIVSTLLKVYNNEVVQRGIINTGKELINSGGNIYKFDVANVLISTATGSIPGASTNIMTNSITELANAAIDFKDGKLTTVGAGKTLENFALDAVVGQVKGLGKTSFQQLEGANVTRDFFWDVTFGQVKNMMGNALITK